ncbi:MAG: hypothetical protein H7Z14_10580 [Anaerolineae bacterium]|nr:hypothetical protein [Phycisphaerae bacterium]
MSDMHQSMNLERFCKEFNSLHGQVIRNWGRIEITSEDGKEACILMSRAELEALERALEIFCSSPAGESICKELQIVARQTTTIAHGHALAAAMAGDSISAGNDQPSL